MSESFEGYKSKLKGRLYGVLCEREKNGDWIKYLDSIIIELLGLGDELRNINYWPLLGKLNALKFLSYEKFRRTIFECINLVQSVELKNE